MNEAAAEYVSLETREEISESMRGRRDREKQRECTVVIHIFKLPDGFCIALT